MKVSLLFFALVLISSPFSWSGEKVDPNSIESKSIESKSLEPAKADKKSQAKVKEPVKVQLSAHQVVDDVTTQLMAAVGRGKESLKNDPSQYFAEVRTIMEDTVDFGFMAKVVMGRKHWSDASEKQRAEFREAFTVSIVETYAKSIANFSDFKITTLKPKKEDAGKSKVIVVQEFRGPSGKNIVSYTMRKRRSSGEWKLTNVVLSGVSLGEALQSQFAQSVVENKGNLDAAIDGWAFSS